jgi:hypothetical protein
MPGRLNVQTDLLADLQTHAVVPLIHARAFDCSATRLHRRFTIDGQEVVMATHLLAAARKQILGDVAASLRDERDVVSSAIDLLWSGV